jgi:hypothetical protein
MERVTFTRTAQAANQERLSKWDVIAAIAADADEAEIPITGGQSQVAAAAAFSDAGLDYTPAYITDLCTLAKYDWESTPKQRQVWRSNPPTNVLILAKAGWAQAAAAEVLIPKPTGSEIRAEIQKYAKTSNRTKARAATFDDRCADWVSHMNHVMMDGAGLLEEAETEQYQLGPHAEMALGIYRRLSERQLEAEIHRFFESQEAR